MPYANEYAKHKTITELVNNKKIQDFMSNMKIITREKSNFEKIDNNILISSDEIEDFKMQERIKYVFAFDGSKTEIQLNSGFPGAEVGILKVSQTFIQLELMKKYEQESFPHPKEYDEIFLSQAFDITIPGFNVSSELYEDPKDFFRFSIYDYMKNNYNKFMDVLIEKSDLQFKPKTLLETYVDLLLMKPEDISCIHPCEYCAHNLGEMLSVDDFRIENMDTEEVDLHHTIKCKCKHNPRDIFITDLLHFHEGFSYSGSNDGLYTQIMSFFEKIIFMNLLDNASLFFSKENGFSENKLFKDCAFILDGPLAIYNYASWVATAMADRIIRMQEDEQLIILGVEKTGHFMSHLENLNSIEKEGDIPLNKGFFFFLEDKYIKRYIKYSSSPIPYGKNFYFGKKMFYKNHDDQMFVINVAFNSFEDKEIYLNARNDKNYETTQLRLLDIIWLFERYSSSRFKNALSFISVAHENASISNNYFSKRVVEDFVSNIISET